MRRLWMNRAPVDNLFRRQLAAGAAAGVDDVLEVAELLLSLFPELLLSLFDELESDFAGSLEVLPLRESVR